jgi:translation elongation factor P/translation initiation factor 5A
MTNTNTQLQGLGTLNAKPASQIKVGDLLSFNYQPMAYCVTLVSPAGKTQVSVSMRKVDTGVEYTRRFKATALVAV